MRSHYQRTVNMDPYSASFFRRSTVEVARSLVGAFLVREDGPDRRVGRIVETEAYTQDDPACHASSLHNANTDSGRRDGRAGDLFAAPGQGYVYLIYGMHWLLNVVTEPEGTAGAVLIRAVEPLEGWTAMRANRGADRRDVELTNGPGKLAEAFGLDDSFHGEDLTTPPLYFVPGDLAEGDVLETSSRIGISKAVERPWRFFIRDHPFVSPATPSNAT